MATSHRWFLCAQVLADHNGDALLPPLAATVAPVVPLASAAVSAANSSAVPVPLVSAAALRKRAAEDILASMEKEGRYVCDSWS